MTPILAPLLALAALGSDPAKPPTAREVEDAVARCAALLIEKQESLDDGAQPAEWPYEGVYRVAGPEGPEIPLGYRVGGTAIAATALLEGAPASARAEAGRAVERALEFVLRALGDARMAAGFEGGYDVRGWGHAYALDFLLELRARGGVPEGRREAVDAAVRSLVGALERTEIAGGGWNYARGKDPAKAAPSTFMTASTLQALFAASAQGFAVDAAVVGRALDALESARLESGAYQYAARPDAKTGERFEAVEGAIGRMPACESTLLLAGRGGVERVRASLVAFFEHWEWLEKRRKQTGTHEGPFAIAPYYFFYAHRYAAQAIELLPEAERAPLRGRLHGLLWRVREASGGWNDRVFPRSEAFGTAMALLALRARTAPPPARWSPPAASASPGPVGTPGGG